MGQRRMGCHVPVCHQIEKARLGTPESFNGNVVFASTGDAHDRPEYGPFDVDHGHQRVMQSSTNGMVPTLAAHIRDAALCGSCHTLKTQALSAGGKEAGSLPEQMPYVEWLHSDYVKKQTCQDCHMPAVTQPVAVTAVFGPLRDGMHRHVFVGGNFLLEQMLHDYHDSLHAEAPARRAAAGGGADRGVSADAGGVGFAGEGGWGGEQLSVAVRVQNLTGHKLPTAYPSRCAWLHVVVTDGSGRTVFESGALHADGSIAGNVNDEDPHRYEPHFTEITDPEQVEIFEPILKDQQGQVTTGLLSAVGYLKDNRLLPDGFDKRDGGAGYRGGREGTGGSEFHGWWQPDPIRGGHARGGGAVPREGGVVVSAGGISVGA